MLSHNGQYKTIQFSSISLISFNEQKNENGNKNHQPFVLISQPTLLAFV